MPDRPLNPRPKFSFLRFLVLLGIAFMAYRTGGESPDRSAVLFGLGMLFLALFGGVFDPLSPTRTTFRPSHPLEWAALVSALVGLLLIGFSLVEKFG